MDLADLRIALTVARAGTLSAAADQMGITQPTVSKAIARLERQTKIRLFERHARGMRPTEIGSAFLAHAERLDLGAMDMYAALRDLRQAKTGTLKFGIGQGVPDRYVTHIAKASADRGICLGLAGGMTDSLQRAVLIGELEFALIGLSQPPTNGLHWVPLRDDPMQPVAPRSTALGRRRTELPWSELAAASWIVPAPGTASYSEFESNFRRHRLQAPQPLVSSQASNREVPLAIELGCVVLMTRSLAEEETVAQRFGQLKPEGGWRSQRKLVLVSRQGGYLSPAAKKAIETVRESISNA